MPEKISIIEFFNPQDIEHIHAYEILRKTGVWPDNFLPMDKHIEFGTTWQIELMNLMAESWLAHSLAEEISHVNTDELRWRDAYQELPLIEEAEHVFRRVHVFIPELVESDLEESENHNGFGADQIGMRIGYYFHLIDEWRIEGSSNEQNVSQWRPLPASPYNPDVED